LIYGLYPFAPCISTREYYYLLRPFILHLLPPAIFHVDLLRPFELSILSNKFSFDHFLGYMTSLLSLMKKKNLMMPALGLDETYICDTLSSFNYWYDIKEENDEGTRIFYLCLMDMSCVLLLLKDPLTKKQFDTVAQRVLDEK
jgi:hypothetical protein